MLKERSRDRARVALPSLLPRLDRAEQLPVDRLDLFDIDEDPCNFARLEQRFENGPEELDGLKRGGRRGDKGRARSTEGTAGGREAPSAGGDHSTNQLEVFQERLLRC